MKEIRLPVKYFSQLDSQTPEAMRMCFSSSVAMLDYHLTGKPIAGLSGQSDDNWLTEHVHRFGDSTDAQAQVSALHCAGIEATYSQRLDLADLQKQLALGIPIPCGILHKGPISAPTGGGHWVLVVGISADQRTLYVHDPAGELDLVAGGYHITNEGAYRRYSVDNFRRRWCCGPVGAYKFTPGTGWGIIARKP